MNRKVFFQNGGLAEARISAITTNNGRNISAAARELGWVNLPCFSHTLQLSVEKVLKLPQVAKAISRCKRIVTHFHHSSKVILHSQRETKSLGHKESSLIQEASTRWNSSYYMVQRILHQQQPICAALLEVHKTDLMPTESEFKSLEEFVTVMKPLVNITEAIGAEKWVTVSTLRLVLKKLLSTHFAKEAADCPLVKTMKWVMLDDLKGQYTGDILSLLSKSISSWPSL